VGYLSRGLWLLDRKRWHAIVTAMSRAVMIIFVSQKQG
jgi:hypothetical protein